MITPCLNSIRTIKETLLSVRAAKEDLARHAWTLEHIIVDGGSLDGTHEWLESYCRSNRFCRYIPNGGYGAYAAMNAGLRQARGHYTHILNADDVLLDPESYASLIRNGYQHAAQILIMSIGYFSRPSRIIRSLWHVKPIPASQEEWRKQLIRGLHYPHPGFIAKTSIYQEESFDERFSLSADYKLMQHILLKAATTKTTMVCTRPVVAMDERGSTGSWLARLRGVRQLSRINKELCINQSALMRYWGKARQRLQRLENPIIVPSWESENNETAEGCI